MRIQIRVRTAHTSKMHSYQVHWYSSGLSPVVAERPLNIRSAFFFPPWFSVNLCFLPTSLPFLPLLISSLLTAVFPRFLAFFRPSFCCSLMLSIYFPDFPASILVLPCVFFLALYFLSISFFLDPWFVASASLLPSIHHHFLPRYPSFAPSLLSLFHSFLPLVIGLRFWSPLSSFHLSFLKIICIKYHHFLLSVLIDFLLILPLLLLFTSCLSYFSFSLTITFVSCPSVDVLVICFSCLSAPLSSILCLLPHFFSFATRPGFISVFSTLLFLLSFFWMKCPPSYFLSYFSFLFLPS